MAKKKKKQRKNNKMPPLWWVDKLIYIVLLTIAIGMLVAYFLFHFFIIEKLYFREAGVIAFDRHASSLWFFPAFMLLFFLIMVLGDAFRSRRPIFGIPNFIYGPSKYPRIYPIFAKDKPKKKVTPKMKRNMLILWCILAGFMLTTFSTSLIGLFGRDCLYEDGSMIEYTMFNKKKDTYSLENVGGIEFSIQSRKTSSRRSGFAGLLQSFKPRKYYVTMIITTTDNKEFHYRSYCFNNEDSADWLDYMLQIKALYSETMISYENTNNIEYVIEQKQLDETEKNRLYKLFNLEP